MFSADSLSFLRSLARNNRRDWFEANRERYETAVRAPMRELIEQLDVRLATIAPEIVGDAKRSMFRIHRDVRFSKDKSPYKTHASAWFYHRAAGKAVGREADSGGAGFYVHLQPGQSLVAGGIWMPPRPALSRIRDAIVDDQRAFERTIGTPAFRRRFGELSDEAMLKRLPRGYAPGHPASRWLVFQSFTVGRSIPDRDMCGTALVTTLAKDFTAMRPLVRWLNAALGYQPAERR